MVEFLDNIIATIVALLALGVCYRILSKIFLHGMKFTKFIKFVVNKLKK